MASVAFPASLKEIGGHAFEDCVALTEVDLSKTALQEISSDAFRRSLNFPWQAPEVLTKDGAYTIQEERDVRNAMQLCSESFDL